MTSNDDDWSESDPKAEGFAPDLGQQLDAKFEAGELPRQHAVIVVRHGHLVIERYYEGEDELFGRPLGVVHFNRSTLHDLRSVTKSIVSLLYGIALSEGRVPSPDAILMNQFLEYPNLASDPERRTWTVEHALTMRLGTEWDESVSYADPRNSERAMDDAPDLYQYVLDRPIVSEPGSTWVYNGGTTALLGRLIARGTEMTLLDFGRERLFGPLGITAVEWSRQRNRDEAAAAGLRLKPRDLARLSQMVLNNGEWRGRQVVPGQWLDQSFLLRATTPGGLGYGFQWWLGEHALSKQQFIAGLGNGGQRLFVLRGLDVVVVEMAGNYNRPSATPMAVLDTVLGALT